MGCIYLIRNTINGKAYIGQTTQKLEYRLLNHFAPSSSCTALKNAIEKHGRDVFTVEILHDGVLDIFLDNLEIAEIEKHNTLAPDGYNLNGGGGGVSPEARQKLSKARIGRKGKPHSPETRRKMSKAQKGKSISPEHRQKISAVHKDKLVSTETRQKISKALTGRKRPPRSPEHLQSLSEANAHPDRYAAFEIFSSLPESMSLTQKRKCLVSKFPDIRYETICRWVRKWLKTT